MADSGKGTVDGEVKMKVLMLTTNASLMDGINRHILAISGGLVREGVEVGVCIVQPRGEFAEELEKVGVKVYSLGCANGHSLKILPLFWKVMREFRPDVVHIHIPALLERFLLSWAFRKVKKIRTVHGIVDPVAHKTIRMRVEAFLERITPIKIARNLYISKGVRQALDAANTNDPVVYNPIDIREMAPRKLLRELIGAPQDAKMIGTACRIAQVKNPQAFTRVMCEVTKRVDGAHAIIIGDGAPELMAELKKIAADSPNVHFFGYRNDARQLISECDCFVMTSAREGMPTAMLEAMTSGVPVAFWKGEGGLIDLVELNEKEGPFGAVAEQGDEENLAKGICAIVLGGLSSSGREVVTRHFSHKEVSRQLKEFYRS